MTSFGTPTRFSFSNENYFGPDIAESVNIAEFFWKKTYDDIGPLPVNGPNYIPCFISPNLYPMKYSAKRN